MGKYKGVYLAAVRKMVVRRSQRMGKGGNIDATSRYLMCVNVTAAHALCAKQRRGSGMYRLGEPSRSKCEKDEVCKGEEVARKYDVQWRRNGTDFGPGGRRDGGRRGVSSNKNQKEEASEARCLMKTTRRLEDFVVATLRRSYSSPRCPF